MPKRKSASSKPKAKKAHIKLNYKYLWHGTKSTAKTLRPRPSHVIDGEEAVFATQDQWVAAVFIAKWEDHQIGFGWANDHAYLIERKRNAFDVFRHTKGYIDRVSATTFRNDKRLGLQDKEFISSEPVKVNKQIYIANVYNYLRKCPDVDMVHFEVIKVVKST